MYDVLIGRYFGWIQELGFRARGIPSKFTVLIQLSRRAFFHIFFSKGNNSFYFDKETVYSFQKVKSPFFPPDQLGSIPIVACVLLKQKSS